MTTAHISGLTDAEAAGIQIFEKPAIGSWTEAVGLPTGPVSFKDSYDPDFYRDEMEAVFRRSWLNIGRVEQLPRAGSYFTKELNFLDVSVLVVRGMDNEIRAFHNVCSHRGNKLMWDDFPNQESRGMCRQFACKYHGWRFDLEGQISYVHNAPEFFDLTTDELQLPKIHLETWGGFIFVNLDTTPRESLRDFLTPVVAKVEEYPFGKLTHKYTFSSEIDANWKLFMDAFQELYHVPYVHGKLNNAAIEQTGVDKIPFMVPHFGIHGKHRMLTSGGPLANVKIRVRNRIDSLFGGGYFGPDDVPDLGPLGGGVNPGGVTNWGLDSWQLYPNFVIITWNHNHYFTYHYWPVSPTRHRFEWTIYFAPPRTTREWLAQEHAATIIREFGLQDANTLEATQRGIMSKCRDNFYLADQEVAVRHLHHTVQHDVEAYRQELAAKKGAL